ncbi:myo-inositol-1(or 4)-monophosphatase [Neorhizobium galegae]|uniref:inositol monophosphatase family protein n=1 Tax=Neorhizobium galegae TaxID=399 RepID=UPI001AE2381B|nr:inositol monophosphatase [Neorhizobium galegae]MBP2551736.1 myo-inositol-1(or 4)-monophosphatase [Neorhizobium galegae]
MNHQHGNSSELAARAALAERMARAAGEMARSFLAHPEKLEWTEKASSQDIVSAADEATEAYLRATIQQHFPADGIVGEEAGSTSGSSGYDWVIDPIDGTMAFLVGQPNWTVSVAVMHAGEPVIGVVAAPMFDEIYVGRSGGGATLNGKPLSINPDWTIRSTTVGFGGTERADPRQAGGFVTRLYQEGGVLFRVGSGALMLAYVAANRLAGYYDPTLFCWDCMAGIVLIREAGGLAEFAGSLTEPGEIWAGNKHVFDDLKRISVAREDDR